MGIIADKIRKAIFGGDVRDSIADGIEVVEQLREDYDKQVINAGNSNAEIVDARGGHIKLKDRLDQVDSHLEQIKNQTIYLRSWGIVGDGEHDNYQDIQTLLDNLIVAPLNAKNIKIVATDKKYKLTKPLYIKRDNVEIDFSNAEIVWAGDSLVTGSETSQVTNVGYPLNRYVGVINAHGEAEFYNGIEFIPYFEAYQQFPQQTNFMQTKLYSKLKTSDNSKFNVNDFIRLTYRTGAMYNSSTNYADTSDIVMDIICMVIGKEGEYLLLDYYSTVNFNNKFNNSTNNGIVFVNTTNEFSKCEVRKLVVRKNIKIKNLYINDTIIPELGETQRGSGGYPGSDYSKFVCGISFKYCVNCETENISGYNTKFPLQMNHWVYDCKFENLDCIEPALWGSGEGYTIQYQGSFKCQANRLRGRRTRHIIDYTFGAFCTARDIRTSLSILNPVAIHGAGEHDLYFEDSQGGISIGHGVPFSNIINNIFFKRHTYGYLSNNSTAYVTNLKFEDSYVFLNRFNPNNVEYLNCKVKINTSDSSIMPNNRINSKSSIVFTNCDISLVGLETRYKVVFREYDKIIFKGGGIELNTPTPVDRPQIVLTNVKQVVLDNFENNNISFVGQNWSGTDTDSNFLVIGGNTNFTLDKPDMILYKPYLVPNSNVSVKN